MEYVRNWLYKASILLIIGTHIVKSLLTFSPQAPIFTGRSCYFWTIDLECVHFLHCELWSDAESAHFLNRWFSQSIKEPLTTTAVDAVKIYDKFENLTQCQITKKTKTNK